MKKTKVRFTLVEFKEYARSKGGQCLSTEFKTIHDKLDWECKEGHQWSAAIRVRTKSPTWCKKCMDKASAGQYHKLNLNDCHDLANKYGGKCLSTEYVNARTKLNWTCSAGHLFSKKYDKVRTGEWCPDCGYTKITEKLIRQLFKKLFKAEFPTVKPDWIVNKEGNRLELDGYNKDLNIAFEYNGIQHYKKIAAFDYDLKAVKSNDKIKKRLCIQKGVKLIIIPYTKFPNGDIEILKGFLKEEFKRLKINIPFNIDKVKISIPEIYKNNEVDRIKQIIEKENFRLISYEYIHGSNYYSIQCPFNHKIAKRNGYQIINRNRSLCKGCALQSKGYKLKLLASSE